MALVQHHPRITLNECRAKLSTPVAKSTLSEEMKRRGLQYRQAVRIPALSQLHITKQIEWCKRMRGQNWSKVFFTDECSIWMNSSKIYVLTKKGQLINLPTFKHPAKTYLGWYFGNGQNKPQSFYRKLQPGTVQNSSK
ncbi:hypothetical protein LOD99_12140 [Oopsacas minuta]|uniref:Transposase Tc1-like domain-containing protein n=1 Tax=Oopsacas minuta TaxID=111878 RepID=A0AAV7JHK1_9METZ|nr:hypothetical protein LOD99_12140 [Oopsacas minuta]